MAEMRWPALMRAHDAAAYLSYSRAQFNALVQSGRLPPGRETIPGHPRWSRRELDLCIERGHAIHAADAEAKEREQAAAALEAFRPPVRRANARRVG